MLCVPRHAVLRTMLALVCASAALPLAGCGDDSSGAADGATDDAVMDVDGDGGADADSDADADGDGDADDAADVEPDGGCTPACTTEECCEGICVDTETDPAHCGGCDDACPWGSTCGRGECRAYAGIEITIVADNTAYDPRLTAMWGFACWITGYDSTILLGTGADPALFLGNLDTLALDAADVGLVMLSHDHTDHTAGLAAFLERNSAVPVYVTTGFLGPTRSVVTAAGATPVLVSDSVVLMTGAYSTGEMGTSISEHGLLLATAEGPVLITGCAHPGVRS